MPLVVFGIDAWVSKSKDSADATPVGKKKTSIMLPSQWILDIMQVCMFFPGYLFSGVFVSAAPAQHDSSLLPAVGVSRYESPCDAEEHIS